MQVASDKYMTHDFEKKAQDHATEIYVNQLSESALYRNLKKVISISILDYKLPKDTKNYISKREILNKSNHKNYLQSLLFVYIELPKFKKDNLEQHRLNNIIEK
jgi:hypothetical protein